MGGLACVIHRNATLKFQAVPTNPVEAAQFDSQMRALLADISQDIVNEASDKVKMVCDTLAKTTWTMADRAALLDVVEGLYEYPS